MIVMSLKNRKKIAHKCEIVPTTAVCAADEARRILGEPRASILSRKSLAKAKGESI